jgi:hypothetical protein
METEVDNMAYQKFNRDKAINIKMGQYHDNRTLLEESAALTKEESKDIEVNMLRESMSNYVKSDNATNNSIMRRQKYLNESNWFALKSYITKLSIDQAKSLYDFKALKEEYGVDPEVEIEQEVEETLMTEIPLTIKGEMGTIIPIKIEVSPETADVVQAVIGIMDQNVGADKAYLDTPQIEDAADEAMTQIPADMPQMKSASDKISDETVGIISKDQELLADMRAKMDDIEARVSENEHVLGLAGEEEYIEPDPGTGPEGAPELIQDPETGLLFDPETGEIYDPKTGEIIKEELHREYRTQTILEALAVKKATKSIRENYNSYNRDLSIVGGINSLIILEAFDHVFGRTTSYAVLKNRLNIK